MRKSAVATLLAYGALVSSAAPAFAAPNAEERVQGAELPADSSDSYQYGFEDSSETEQASMAGGAAPAGGARAVQTNNAAAPSGSAQHTAAPDQAAAGQSIDGVEVAVNTHDAPAFAR